MTRCIQKTIYKSTGQLIRGTNVFLISSLNPDEFRNANVLVQKYVGGKNINENHFLQRYE